MQEKIDSLQNPTAEGLDPAVEHIPPHIMQKHIAEKGETLAAAAYLGSVKVGSTELSPFGFDALTVNAYLGSDGIKPFIETAVRCNKAVFVLVKTSNPSSGELQDKYIGEERLYTVVGGLMEEIRFLRERLAHTFFLVPGYGAQGEIAKDAALAFDRNGHGAVINSSRAIIAAWKKTGAGGADYAAAARAEALRMRDELRCEIYG